MQFLDTSRIQEIAASITRMSSLVDLTKSQYPYLPLTFSIWRKEKYQDLKLHTDNSLLPCLTVKFHQQLDKRLLPLFIGKVKEGLRDSFKALRAPSASRLKQFQEEEEYDALTTQYIEAATGQLYRLEILADILTLPYGIKIKESYYLRKQYTSYEQLVNQGMIAGLINKHGKTVVSKGLSALGAQMWGRVALLVVGGMNVLGLASGVVISQTVDLVFSRLSKNKRKQKLEQQIIKFNNNSVILQTCIRKCSEIIDRYVQSEDESERKSLQSYFYTQIQKVFILDSQQTITIVDLEKGWKMVEMAEDDQQFQQIKQQEENETEERDIEQL